MQAKVQYPKLLTFLIFSLAILIHLENHLIIKGSFHQSLQVGMFYIIDSFTGFGYLISDPGVIIGSYWIHICSSLVKVSCVCSLAIG